MTIEPATMSALSALIGSAIGAFASVATTWLTQHHQDRMRRLTQEVSHREQLFMEFIDQASRTYADGIVQQCLEEPAKLVPIYATMNKLRLFASPGTIGAAEAVLERIVETYETPSTALQAKHARISTHDLLQTFAKCCRAELARLA